MTTVLILEDNELQLEALATILEQNLPSISILKASNYETARALALNHSVQFFLLDVELDTKKPDSLTGVDFGKYLRTLPEYEFVPILFITSIPDQIQTAVNQIHCQSYILKPYTPEELLEAVHFVFKIPNLPAPSVRLCDNNGIYHKLSEKDILYIESSGKDMLFHMSSANLQTDYCISTSRYRLMDLGKMLSDSFFQCHKRYLVNLEHITSYDKTACCINIQKTLIPIGRKFKSDFENVYLNKIQ